jgi:hypothetical protein
MSLRLVIVFSVFTLSLTQIIGQINHVKIHLNGAEIEDVCDSLFEERATIKYYTCFSIYSENNETLLRKMFHVAPGGYVHGFYKDYFGYGNYHLDSTWSFRKPRVFSFNDTISSYYSPYKIGTWLYLSNRYDIANTLKEYKKVYNSDSLYKENWYYEFDKPMKESVYHQRKGLVSEKFYSYNGEIEYFFLKTRSGELKISFDNNDVSELSFDNELFSYDVKTVNGGERKRFYDNYEGMNTDVLSDNEGKTIQFRVFYPNGNIKTLFDYKNDLKFEYDDDGKFISKSKLSK